LSNLYRILFYGVFIKFIVKVILGLNIKNLENFPKEGPAVIIANHNSHLDTMIIMSLVPFKQLLNTHPVASMEYFMQNRIFSWFSINVVGIIPIQRLIKKSKEHPFKRIYEALSNDEIVIYFPEGSRGEPEELSKLKSGISRISQEYPSIPIVPIALNGAGKVLPKGKILLVPLTCQVLVGSSIYWEGEREMFMKRLEMTLTTLIEEGDFIQWE